MRIALHRSIDDIDAVQWNSMVRNAYPFLRHEFLAALENGGAVGKSSGWHPCYLSAERDGQLLGALPMFLKDHSFGEFVFDWAWAGAYERHGLSYYPKLVVAVPYTPVTGDRILLARDKASSGDFAEALIDAALVHAVELGVSSLHWLFTTPEDAARLQARGFMRRAGYQFHWDNPGYEDFEDFLAALSSRNRKKLRSERRAITAQGIEVEVLEGPAVTSEAWDMFYRFYLSTYIKNGHPAPFSRDFFHELADRISDQIMLIMARHGGEYVAGALFFTGERVLYGRHWGSTGGFHNLHFELCYYRAIDYCIEHGLTRFEAGAQGEHKVRRGFCPVKTTSMHWVADGRFGSAIGDFLGRESDVVDAYIDEIRRHLPYRAAS